MLIYAFKKKTESNEKLILRYKKMFFQTRVANKLRNERYNVRDLSKRKIREKAIIRENYRFLNKK
ncbi:MAG: hypothetical protein ACD_49C00077G0006 [uncultured bacterium (gcode 4)]|uniref:30S ribosomal protein S21 n=1 Tax=uncultured bacterium (gcode 4) TaxID=1234023 RepID=K2BAT8_9BACT|nr:MAG: hypothetical protein ACD_49C00077G0006 [uncultured bacterium (gcode 4)]HBA44973.1 hypothetical protein [Candidatus Gracilibacteria bacterium]